MNSGWRRYIRPHNILATIFIFFTLWVLSFIHIDHHVLNPFKNGVKDYDVTDIVYSRLRDEHKDLENRIVLVNTGNPDRLEIQQMLERIFEAEPKVVGVDVLFDGKKDPHTDSLLQATIKSSDRLILATNLGDYSEETHRFMTESANDTFFQPYARTGYANFPSNETRTLRLFSPHERTARGSSSAFAVEIAALYDPGSLKDLNSRHNHLERIHYTTDIDNYIRLEPETILDTAFDIRSRLKDKIVLLGYLENYTTEDPIVDRFYTPLNEKYTGRSIPDMYGVVVHANIIKMLLDRNYVGSFPKWIIYLFGAILIYVNTFFFFWNYKYWWYFKPFPNILYRIGHLVQVVQIVLMFFVMAWVFASYQIKIEFKVPIVALILAFDLCTIYYYLRKNFSILGNIPEYFPKKGYTEPPAEDHSA
jgi:CHASE2 domain-containing sensor protein